MSHRIGTTKAFHVGDVIRMNGALMDPDLHDKWFRVDAIASDGSIVLSDPYVDAGCKHRYQPIPKLASETPHG